ncbi:hypothetical protein [Pseudoxanthomonas sp. CF125]|uniref:hypothetical protein n=1 Tax=Pseudoxanthomonas sp. CF125 TaxID=1855303 RepID=UPI000888D554|nr:hypothetical protein [Pseudoxanthomonas sp. CF125]SDR06531.1 hypothetical protein SAMN05216569_2901 [Pseudoxanthomonas sp. CF125]
MTRSKIGLIKARVLVTVEINGKISQPNDVIEVDDDTLWDRRASLDADPAAVAYAESLHAKAKRKRELERELTLE